VLSPCSSPSTLNLSSPSFYRHVQQKEEIRRYYSNPRLHQRSAACILLGARTKTVELTPALHALLDLLVELKPLLHVPLLPNVSPRKLLETLSSISSNASTLSGLCTKAAAAARKQGGKRGGGVSGELKVENQDYLDGEGVQIWNRSGEYKIQESGSKAEVFGASE
jgi:hypothetical protein